MDLPLASVVYAVIGCFVLMLTPVLAWIIHGLLPNAPLLAWGPVVLLPGMYVWLFFAYRRAHKDTKSHDTSTFRLHFIHGLSIAVFAAQAAFVDQRLLGAIFAFGSFLLITFYLNYFALCLAVWTRPALPAAGAFLIAVLSFVLTLMRLESRGY